MLWKAIVRFRVFRFIVFWSKVFWLKFLCRKPSEAKLLLENFSSIRYFTICNSPAKISLKPLILSPGTHLHHILGTGRTSCNWNIPSQEAARTHRHSNLRGFLHCLVIHYLPKHREMGISGPQHTVRLSTHLVHLCRLYPDRLHLLSDKSLSKEVWKGWNHSKENPVILGDRVCGPNL